MTIRGELDESLLTTPTMPRDAVTVAVARRYADALDDCFDELVGAARPCPRCSAMSEGDAVEDGAAHARVVLEITRLGARLEAVLDRLGMSPGARPSLPPQGGSGGTSPEADALGTLRRDAAAGAPASGLDYTAAVDPAVAEADAAD